MPTNLYCPFDNFHVIPALIRRIHEADSVTIWNRGVAKREFLFVDDMAEACFFMMNLTSDKHNSITQTMLSHLNVGSGQDYGIAELAELLFKIIRFKGQLVFDHSHPDGTPRKLLDVSCQKSLGWQAKVGLNLELERTYRWYLTNEELLRC